MKLTKNQKHYLSEMFWATLSIAMTTVMFSYMALTWVNSL